MSDTGSGVNDGKHLKTQGQMLRMKMFHVFLQFRVNLLTFYPFNKIRIVLTIKIN